MGVDVCVAFSRYKKVKHNFYSLQAELYSAVCAHVQVSSVESVLYFEGFLVEPFVS